MRRYWKLIGIATVVVLTIGTLYVQSIVAKATYPNYFIETKSGDEQLLTGLVIHGEYQEKDEVVYNTITKDGTVYQADYGYIDLILGNHYPNKLQALQKKHRNFMRGKEDLDSFSENDEVLVYVNMDWTWTTEYTVEDVTFEVDTLQKDSKNKTSFDIPIPKQESIDYMYVLHVNVLNDTIQVVTQKSVYIDGNYEDSLHVYELDMSTKKLLSDAMIEFPGINQNYDAHAFLMDSNHENQSNDFLFSAEEYSENELTDEGYQNKKENQEFILYNLETNTQEVIGLSEEIDLEFTPELYMDQTIYFTKETEDAYQIIGYNIDDEQIETDYTIDLNEGLDAKGMRVNVDGEYVYMYNPLKSKSSDALFTISHIKTGELLYEGSIELDSSEQLHDTSLDITYIMED